MLPVAHRSDVLAQLSADASVLKAMGLSRCSLFGSFARDQAIRPDSDVDLLVSFQAGRKDFDAYLELVPRPFKWCKTPGRNALIRG